MNDYLLVLNAGSSSLKFCVYRRPGKDWRLISRGQIEGIGTVPRMVVKDSEAQTIVDRTLGGEVRGSRDALEVLAGWLRSTYRGARVLGVGHRVVHGGPKYSSPIVITPQVMAELYRLAVLAPLHQPYNLAAIEAVAKRLPEVPQVACFDTGFHRTLPPVAQLVPLPREICNGAVQRYRFHGISCAWAPDRVRWIQAWFCTCSKISVSMPKWSRRFSIRRPGYWAFQASAATCAICS